VSTQAPPIPGLARYIRPLDGLRGVAIALVFLHNCNLAATSAQGVSRWLSRLAGIGWIGVTLFFVLSGFLITRGLLESRGSRQYFRAFFARRALRILPVYYVTLLVLLVVVPAFPWTPKILASESTHQLWYWLFLTNWTFDINGIGGALPHFWSLAVEEQFYLIWPVVVYLVARQRLALACWILVAASLLLRIFMSWNGASWIAIYQFTPCRMDALAMGALVAINLADTTTYQRLAASSSRLVGIAVVAAIFVACLPGGTHFDRLMGATAGFTGYSMAFALAMTSCILLDQRDPTVMRPLWHRTLASQPLVSLGKYSYAFYVFHLPIHMYLGPLLRRQLGWGDSLDLTQNLLYLGIVGAVTLALSWVSYHALEKRILALKRLIFPTSDMPTSGHALSA
jgi:peptidoglycan/LPS O-acetylase OafA/YrhL